MAKLVLIFSSFSAIVRLRSGLDHCMKSWRLQLANSLILWPFFLSSTRPAVLAATTVRLYHPFKIFFTIVVSDFFSGPNIPHGKYPNSASLRDDCFSVRFARMINISRYVAARASINRPLLIDTKKVQTIAPFDFFICNQWSKVFDDSFAFRNLFYRYQSQPGDGPFDSEKFRLLI